MDAYSTDVRPLAGLAPGIRRFEPQGGGAVWQAAARRLRPAGAGDGA